MVTLLRHNFGEFAAGAAIGPAEWPHFDLLFAHRGTVRLDFPSLGERVDLPRGRGVLIYPHTPFRGVAGRTGVRASIQHFAVTAGAWPPFESLLGRRHGFRLTRGASGPLSADVVRAIAARQRPVERESTGTSLALLALILEEGGVLAAVAVPAVRLGWVELAEQLRAHDWLTPGVAALAQANALSASRFRALFQQEHGIAAGEFVRRWREAEAKRLLIETRLPVKEVARRIGFADVVSFHRSFAGRTGVTPAAYRRAHALTG